MPDLPQNENDRAALEAKVTALLLGELPEQEAADLRSQLDRDAELRRWHDQASLTLGLLRDTVGAPDERSTPQSPPLKLSEPRRQQLLAHFKTVRPKEFRPRPNYSHWGIWVGMAAALMLLASISIPNFSRARSTSMQNAIVNNLRLPDAAKQQWALEKGKPSSATPTKEDLMPYMGRGIGRFPGTVGGESYVIGAVGQAPVAVTKKERITLPGEPANVPLLTMQPMSEPPSATGTRSATFSAAPDREMSIANSAGVDGNNRNSMLTESLGEIPAPPAAQSAMPPTEKTSHAAEYRLDGPTSGALYRLSQNDEFLARKVPAAPPVFQGEIQAVTNAFSTFSLNVSDVSFNLARATLSSGHMPDAAQIRSEEFVNAFDYRDPEPAPGAPIAFAWDRAAYPFAHNRDLLRFSVKTAAQGRQTGVPLNVVLLLDKSGSMERADRVAITRQALAVLASQLHEQDTLSVVVFARTARLWADGLRGDKAGGLAQKLSDITPEGGTNLEEAMKLAYATALRHYLANGENRVVLLTDGAANLGDVDPDSLKRNVETNRVQNISFDCFGIGWEGYNDQLLETLSRTGGGRYGFINTPEEAGTEFAGKLAGALRVAAADVKTQVEFNSNRVTSFRQIGYAKFQLTKEEFRDDKVKAAQIGAAESGTALYIAQINSAGDGPIATVRVRFHAPGSTDTQERAWTVPYLGPSLSLDKSAPSMRLAATACAFSEWLAQSPFAGDVTPDRLMAALSGVPETFGADTRPTALRTMILEAKSISGK